MNFVIKWITVLLTLGVGIYLAVHGWGANIPAVEYKGLKITQAPLGLIIFAGGIVLAAVWKTETSVTTTIRKGGLTIITETVMKMFRGD